MTTKGAKISPAQGTRQSPAFLALTTFDEEISGRGNVPCQRGFLSRNTTSHGDANFAIACPATSKSHLKHGYRDFHIGAEAQTEKAGVTAH